MGSHGKWCWQSCCRHEQRPDHWSSRLLLSQPFIICLLLAVQELVHFSHQPMELTTSSCRAHFQIWSLISSVRGWGAAGCWVYQASRCCDWCVSAEWGVHSGGQSGGSFYSHPAGRRWHPEQDLGVEMKRNQGGKWTTWGRLGREKERAWGQTENGKGLAALPLSGTLLPMTHFLTWFMHLSALWLCVKALQCQG